MVVSDIKVIPYYKDADYLFKHLRKLDREELVLSSSSNHINPLFAIKKAYFTNKNTYSLFYKGKLLGCCGYEPKYKELEGFGFLWLLSTNHSRKYKLAYVKAVKMALEYAKEDCPKGLYISVMKKYKKAVKLTEFLKFKPIKEFTIQNEIFIIYLLKGEDYGWNDSNENDSSRCI